MADDRSANDRSSVKQFSRNFLKCMDILNMITNICIGAVAFAAIYIAQLLRNWNILGIYTTHVILVTVGYILMMSQAVLSLNATAGWTKAFKHQQRKLIHLILELIGAAFAISGTIYAIVNSSDTAKSGHGIMGIIAMSLTLLGSLGGAFHFFFPDKSAVPIKMVHSCVGSLALIAAFTTFIIGLHKFQNLIYSDATKWMYTAMAIVALVGTLASACISNIRRLIN